MSAISVHNVTKRYGSLTAVDDFGFSADESEIVALVGPDGAGKTTLFRVLCGLMEFDAGGAEIFGYDVKTRFDRIKPLLGYMPQAFSLYLDLSVEENLRFYAGLFGTTGRQFKAKRDPLYEFSGLAPFRNRRAADLSGGMKQKLALSCALVHDPRVLVLDEPTTGVDPLSRRQFWEILTALQSTGTTIVVSTPYMDEVARADRAIFIHGGRKLAEGTPGELAAQYRGEVYRIRVAPTPERMRQLQGIDGIDVRRFGAAVHVYPTGEVTRDRLLTALATLGIAPDRVESVRAELEDAFIQLMGQ